MFLLLPYTSGKIDIHLEMAWDYIMAETHCKQMSFDGIFQNISLLNFEETCSNDHIHEKNFKIEKLHQPSSRRLDNAPPGDARLRCGLCLVRNQPCRFVLGPWNIACRIMPDSKTNHTKPFSFLTKELVEDWQDRGIWEEMGFVELSDLDASVGAHVQVDMVTPVQEILLIAVGVGLSHEG